MRIKNIKVPVSRHVIDAAFMAGMPVSLYVLRAVNNAACDTLDSANRVLLEAGIRDKAYQDMQREKRQAAEIKHDRDMQLHSKIAAYGSNRYQPCNSCTTPINCDIANKCRAPKPTVKLTPKYNEDGDLSGFDREVHHYVQPTPEADDRTYQHTPRQRGLIADFKGEFYNTHKRATTLTDKQVWHCHNNVFNRRLDLGLTVGTNEAFFAEVIAEMTVFETAR